jgi:signal transduction histidine kinase
MLSSANNGESIAGYHSPRLLVLDDALTDLHEITAPLVSQGYRVVAVPDGGEALQDLSQARPALAVVAHGPTDSPRSVERSVELRNAARKMGIPVLDVVDSDVELSTRLEAIEGIDDWVVRGTSTKELIARVARLIRSQDETPGTTGGRAVDSPIDVEFSAMVVHDLRTPLNVIGLSLRMIEQALPRDDPEVEEDLRFIDENFRQIERMLTQLSDYARQFDPGLKLAVCTFDPRRLVDELVESRASKPGWKGAPVRVDVQKSCPAEVTLDQVRSRMAIEYALINANGSAGDAPIRLTLRGEPRRWIIEVGLDRPPPPSVQSVELQSQSFERLCGCAADRRGMDLAITARICELFGGSARLDVVEGRESTIRIEWPTQIAESSSNA